MKEHAPAASQPELQPLLELTLVRVKAVSDNE